MGLAVFWTHFAEAKLEDIYEYYKVKASKTTALKMVDGIVQKSIALKENPRIGQKEELLSTRPEEFRYLVYKTYKIIYWLNTEKSRIEISNVFDCRQNPIKTLELE